MCNVYFMHDNTYYIYHSIFDFVLFTVHTLFTHCSQPTTKSTIIQNNVSTLLAHTTMPFMYTKIISYVDVWRQLKGRQYRIVFNRNCLANFGLFSVYFSLWLCFSINNIRSVYIGSEEVFVIVLL